MKAVDGEPFLAHRSNGAVSDSQTQKVAIFGEGRKDGEVKSH
jgi:hypothetical protein